jgi:hypothetical protein
MEKKRNALEPKYVLSRPRTTNNDTATPSPLTRSHHIPPSWLHWQLPDFTPDDEHGWGVGETKNRRNWRGCDIGCLWHGILNPKIVPLHPSTPAWRPTAIRKLIHNPLKAIQRTKKYIDQIPTRKEEHMSSVYIKSAISRWNLLASSRVMEKA